MADPQAGGSRLRCYTRVFAKTPFLSLLHFNHPGPFALVFRPRHRDRCCTCACHAGSWCHGVWRFVCHRDLQRSAGRSGRTSPLLSSFRAVSSSKDSDFVRGSTRVHRLAGCWGNTEDLKGEPMFASCKRRGRRTCTVRT